MTPRGDIASSQPILPNRSCICALGSTTPPSAPARPARLLHGVGAHLGAVAGSYLRTAARELAAEALTLEAWGEAAERERVVGTGKR